MIMEERGEKSGEQQVRVVEEEEAEDDPVLPGFRFHPTDEELVGFYLRRKVEKKCFSIEIIREIDIYKHDPWDLPSKLNSLSTSFMLPSCRSKMVIVCVFMSACGSSVEIVSAREKEWYFFCLRGRKYRNSIRPNRVTGSGFWKATGIDRPIYSGNVPGGDCIGLKKSLVYYRGSAGKGTKTDWMMHEYRLPCKNSDTATATPSTHEAWNSMAQAPTPTSHSALVSTTPGVNDFFRDGNWDELGRIVGFMTDQSVASCCQDP
ncbi:hypothetical protein B296_00030022 [Ensete ventricosum]|uniref:NAC domain-containing protein n=1 Tax=Ensete ventricosum TaxID=4639 RepID=A0A426XCH5_ENSVE|nr:hypothetical protein B296_00030022 [Ensete ventricosum]